MSQLKPKYQHDCTACQFLGQYVTQGHTLDLYYCPQDLVGPTLVYRHGDPGPDYGSIPPNMLQHLKESHPDKIQGHPGLAAYKLAQKRGLIHEPATV